jgi:hypothetical protein
MPGEPTPEDAGLRQQALLDLHALTHGWTLYQVVRIVESDLQRQIDDEILADHGYHYTWGARSRTYENPDLKGSDASMAAELVEMASNWTRSRLVRQFPDSAAGRAQGDLVTGMMRQHGYEPEPPVNDGQGRVNITFVSAEERARREDEATRLNEQRALALARQNAERASEERYGQSSRLIGLLRTSESFECSECGRWADVVPSAEVYAELVKVKLGFGLGDWSRVRLASKPSSPLRPAFLQREFSQDYDEAVAVINAAVQLGMLEITKKGVVAALPRCAQCYERRAAAPEASQSEPKGRDLIPPQLRFRVLQRDAFRCQYCGRSARDGATLHLDHVVPFAAGGETTEDNLITACETCNLGKSASGVV